MPELSHKKLIAWQKAIQLLALIYEVCSKLPKEENYNIISNETSGALSFKQSCRKSFKKN
jgi:hypothetical protein